MLPTLFGEETELNAPMVEIVDSVAFRCGRAADALEAQAARITELEQFLIRMGLRPDHLVP